MAALHAGQRLGGYTLLAPLHEGGMASLWRVSHPQQTFPLLMKVPHLGYGDHITKLVGFEVERLLMPALHGPHVPRFVASGDEGEQPWLVMEQVAGDTLRGLLEQAPLPAERVAHLGALAATALDALHRQGAVHLDVKPSNLILQVDPATGEERIVLIDFGLSHHQHLPDLLAEQFHVPIGTGPYIAPEQVLGVRDDPRSDLFALGVTLYHLATGERPFGNPTGEGGLKRRLYRDPPPPRVLKPDLPRWLQEIVLRCLEVDPDARYPTAAQLAFDLRYPEQVPLTERAGRTRRDGRLAVARRWFGRYTRERALAAPATQHLAQAPLLMVAIDLKHEDPALCRALHESVQRALQTTPGARLACVTVMRTARIGMDSNLDAAGRNRHVKRLVALRDWVRPLQLDEHRVTFHVLAAHDPAAALVEYARTADVDHILLGARGLTGVRRMLGSVSARVVAEAPCTATVVRVRGEPQAP